MSRIVELRVLELVDELVGELREFEPGVFSGEACVRLVAAFSTAEKALSAARGRAAVRASECGAHRAAGFSDASAWLAREAGTTARDARSELETTRALESCPQTAEALAAGHVSLAQAAEIVKTVAEVPSAEPSLLEIAQSGGLTRLREEGRKQRCGAVRGEELHAKQRAVREVRHWRDELGMVSGTFRLTPDVGVPFVNRLEREAQRIRRAAKRAGCEERFEAHMADAFVATIANLAEPEGEKAKAKARAVDLVMVCDVNAYRRGHAHPSEVCHIVGGGPIPVAVVKELSQDAFLKAVIHDGVKIHTVKHFGRHVPAELRTALELGPLPDLDEITCIEEECDRRYGLEWDHIDPVANGGVTSYSNLVPRCQPDHWEKTERDRAAGRLGPRTRVQPSRGKPP